MNIDPCTYVPFSFPIHANFSILSGIGDLLSPGAVFRVPVASASRMKILLSNRYR